MARAGRGFPLSTQYLQQPSVQTSHRMQGSATFRLTATNETNIINLLELQGTSLSTARILGTTIRSSGMRAVCLNNDHVIIRQLRQLNDATGTFEPATGLSAVSGYFSLTVDGAEIPGLRVDLVGRSGQAGVYFGTIQGQDLATHLINKVGQLVYERVVLSDDYSDSVAYTVQGVRVIQ